MRLNKWLATKENFILKDITIYSVASCDTTTRIGHYNASLEYKGKFKYLSKKVEDTTTNRLIL